jgi:hypothetical protein
MEGMETLQYTDRDQWYSAYDRLHNSEEANEQQVVKWTEPVAVMLSEEEFKLDERGRVIYHTAYFLAYPRESTWKRLKEKN